MITSRRMAATPFLALVLMTGATLAACGSSSKKSTGSSSATTASTAAVGGTTTTTLATAAGGSSSSAASASLTISGFAFSPDKLTVAAGAKIGITNKDGVEHTVTANDGSFHTPVTGATAALTAPTKPGTYPFHCNIHTTMHGTLVVT